MNSAPRNRCPLCGERVTYPGNAQPVYPWYWLHFPDGYSRRYYKGIDYAHKVCPSVEPPEPPDGATAC